MRMVTGLPSQLPTDIQELIALGQTERAAKTIAARFGVSQIDALRVINNVLGGVAPDAELHRQPPDEVFVTARGGDTAATRLEVYHAPAGSHFRDEFRLVYVDPVTGNRRNSVAFTWDDAVAQGRKLLGIAPEDWTLESGSA